MTTNLHPADVLLTLKAQIAELEILAAVEHAKLVAMGVGTHEGALSQASVSLSHPVTPKWKAIAEHFNPSRQLITAHTPEPKPVWRVKVAARS